jgi:hypothetical protein
MNTGSNTQNFMLISNQLKKLKKVINKDGNMHFSTFSHSHQVGLLINFFCFIFWNFLNGFEISMKLYVFYNFFDLFNWKFLNFILALFANFEAKRTRNGSKKRKYEFCKCALEFHYVHHRVYLFIFLTNFKFVVPKCPSYFYITLRNIE